MELELAKQTDGHLALPNNIRSITLLLIKELKNLELPILLIIQDKTIGWRKHKAYISIDHFCEILNKKSTHIYTALRALKKRGIITWDKTKDGSIFGLDESLFGQLLIDEHENEYRESIARRYNKVSDGIRHSDRRNTSQVVTADVTSSDGIRHTKHTQDINIIEENGDLKKDLNKKINKSLKESESGGHVCVSQGNGDNGGNRDEENQALAMEKIQQIISGNSILKTISHETRLERNNKQATVINHPTVHRAQRDPNEALLWLKETNGQEEFEEWRKKNNEKAQMGSDRRKS